MTGFGMGSANPGAVVPGLPLGSAVWAPGGWWDLVAVPGSAGANITANVASQAGSNVLVPLSNPVVNDTAIGGQRGCYVVDTGVADTEPCFKCDALAAHFTAANSPFCVGCDFRQSKQANIPIWSVRSSTPGVTDAISAYSVNEALVVRYVSGGVTTTISGTISLAYDYHRLIVDYDGTTLKTYVDGVLDISQALAKPALNVNRFRWLASESSARFEGATGYARRLFESPSSIGGSGVATVDAYLVDEDFTLPATDPLVPNFLTVGASIMAGTTANTTHGGFRAGLSQAIISGRYSWYGRGDHPQGIMPFRETPSFSGQTATAIAAMVATWANSKTSLIWVDLGNAEINAGQNAAVVLAAITSALHDIRVSAYAVNPACRIAQSNILPYSEAPFNAVTATVNAALPALWAASDAQFPTAHKIMRLDGNTTIGGPSYVQANYTPAGDDHPNQTGYDLLIPAWLAAANNDGETVASVLASLSPT